MELKIKEIQNQTVATPSSNSSNATIEHHQNPHVKVSAPLLWFL